MKSLGVFFVCFFGGGVLQGHTQVCSGFTPVSAQGSFLGGLMGLYGLWGLNFVGHMPG